MLDIYQCVDHVGFAKITITKKNLIENIWCSIKSTLTDKTLLFFQLFAFAYFSIFWARQIFDELLE